MIKAAVIRLEPQSETAKFTGSEKWIQDLMQSRPYVYSYNATIVINSSLLALTWNQQSDSSAAAIQYLNGFCVLFLTFDIYF